MKINDIEQGVEIPPRRGELAQKLRQLTIGDSVLVEECKRNNVNQVAARIFGAGNYAVRQENGHNSYRIWRRA